jgi:hypothetical protein
MILFCRLCDAGFDAAGQIPVQCPACQRPTRWGTTPPRAQQEVDGWTLTPEDRRYLRAIRIEAD